MVPLGSTALIASSTAADPTGGDSDSLARSLVLINTADGEAEAAAAAVAAVTANCEEEGAAETEAGGALEALVAMEESAFLPLTADGLIPIPTPPIGFNWDERADWEEADAVAELEVEKEEATEAAPFATTPGLDSDLDAEGDLPPDRGTAGKERLAAPALPPSTIFDGCCCVAAGDAAAPRVLAVAAVTPGTAGPPFATTTFPPLAPAPPPFPPPDPPPFLDVVDEVMTPGELLPLLPAAAVEEAGAAAGASPSSAS